MYSFIPIYICNEAVISMYENDNKNTKNSFRTWYYNTHVPRPRIISYIIIKCTRLNYNIYRASCCFADYFGRGSWCVDLIANYYNNILKWILHRQKRPFIRTVLIYIYDKTREYVTYIYILNVISFDASAWRKLTRSILVLYNVKPCEQWIKGSTRVVQKKREEGSISYRQRSALPSVDC